MEHPVSIIIPVYNGFDALRHLAKSLFAHTDSRHEIIFIDDASTDSRIAPMLKAFASGHPNVRVVSNGANSGFPHNVNLGASLSDRDFVILNSDTEVPANWIPRLFRPIWEDASTASATPFASKSTSHGFMTNQAVGEALCARFGVETIDRILSTLPANPAENTIPKGHGFCMAISRAAWETVGPFDEARFGRGYGEETEWCFRASRRFGLVNRLAPNLLVGHRHNGSFRPDEAKRLIAEHHQIINQLYPGALKLKCRDQPAFIKARALVKIALTEAGMLTSSGMPVAAKPSFLLRIRNALSRFRPVLKRDLLLTERTCREKLQRQSERIRELKHELKALKAQVADIRYLANMALPPDLRIESTRTSWRRNRPNYLLHVDPPRTFCEKIQCLKTTADTPLMTRLADKYAVREWVAGKIGEKYLIPLLGVWNRAEDVAFDTLPDRFVLKANHGSHMMRIVTDKATLDIPALRAEMHQWLSVNYAFVMPPQMQYANIPRRIIAESYIENADGELHDWKVWCYRGKARYVEYMSRLAEKPSFVFMDRDWNKAPFAYRLPGMEEIPEPPPKPDNLDELLILAETLAEGFEFVRTDFYRLDDGTYRFGEMTFSPSGGNAQFDPPEWDAKIGALFEYTPDNLIH